MMDKALKIQAEVQKILDTDEVYLVGGSIRDLVMGFTPKDYDFTTSMLPEEVEARVKAAGRHAYTIGKQFGTIGFKVPYEVLADYSHLPPDSMFPQDHSRIEFEYVEVTTFRSEVYTSKSRKPEVKFVPSLDEDLARRDFTMNAMVLRSDGSIYDPYGGRLDIHAKQIKTVGLPKDRIQEDPLRILRAARFAARWGFTIDPNFVGKARQLAPRIVDVSRERWVQELDKLLMGEFHSIGVRELENMGVMKFILPEISFMMNQYNPLGNEYQNKHYTFDMENIWAVPLFETSGIPIEHRWKLWLEHISMPASRKYTEYGYISTDQQKLIAREMMTGICHRLKFSNDRTNYILDKVNQKH
jgi:poly(A) polymerase